MAGEFEVKAFSGRRTILYSEIGEKKIKSNCYIGLFVSETLF